MKLDNTDIQIIELLKRNAKLSMRELARLVHLSAPSVADRVKRLEDEGIIEGYTIQINRKKLGFALDCWIEVTLRSGDILKFKEFIKNCPNVIKCYCVAGRACYMMLVAASSLPEIERIVNDMAPFAETATSVVFSEVETSNDLIHHTPRVEN